MEIKFDKIDELENKVYVIYDGAKKVGHIMVRFDMCTIMNVWVDEDLRIKGYGTKLVRYIESLAMKKGCNKMRTNPINPESRGFFEKLGYMIDDNECGIRNL